MAIVPSRAKEIERLIRALGQDGQPERESAAARLTLVGERALAPLVALLDSRPPVATLLAALSVIERLGPQKALPSLTALLRHDDPRVGECAARLLAGVDDRRVLRPLAEALGQPQPSVRLAALSSLARLHESGVIEALGPLVETLLDEAQDSDLRIHALEALASVPREELRALAGRLQRTSDRRLLRRAQALGLAGPPTPSAIARLIEGLESPGHAPQQSLGPHDAEVAGPLAAEALVGRLERTPLATRLAERLGSALIALGPEALPAIHAALTRPVPALALQVLARVLAQTRAASSVPRIDAALRRLSASAELRDDPENARAAAELHLALAAHGSRIALYDLRDRLSRRPALAAPSLLEAAGSLGDASLVPPLTALAHETPALRAACQSALGAIVRRARLRRSPRLLRTIPAAQQPTLHALWPKPATSTRRRG